MTSAALRATVACALLASAACTGAPPVRRALPEVAWPEPPAAPRVRLAAVHPDPEAPPAKRSFWRAALEVVAGLDRRADGSATFVRPFGVAVEPGGSLVVTDPDAQRVVRIAPSGALSDLGCRKAAWGAPLGVARAADGTLYVADGAAATIVRWTPGGCAVLGAGAFERPAGVAVGGNRLYVVDTPRHEVVVLSLSGEVMARWGGRGDGQGRLSFPTGVAVAPDGAILVVDALNFRVARFSPEGRWLGSFGARGDTGGDLARPKAIAADEDGVLYVSDAQRGQVLVFSAAGAFDAALGEPGEEAGRFVLPAGVGAASGKLYVADSQNHRVQVFDILGGPR
jgi:sugar lactone lactonase YvrE